MYAQPLRSSSPDLYHGKYVAGMFAGGEQGVWYDPSDLSTLFQDAAGTIPVTAVEQPVGRILDKSGRGNHATQTTTASRPVLSARVNLLTNTEKFSSWDNLNSVVIANAAAAPNGLLTASLLYPSSSGNARWVYQLQLGSAAGGALTRSVYAKANGKRFFYITWDGNGALSKTVFFDLINGTLGSVANGATASIFSVGNGWYKCTLTIGSTVSTDWGLICGPSDANNSINVTADGTSGIYLWGADLRVANESPLIPSYQRVNTATDYDTQGFPLYLRFDGVDDWLVTPTVNFTATDKVTAFAGVRKFSDATAGAIVELSATPTAADFTARFSVTAAAASLASYGLGMTTNSGASGTYQIRALTYTAPITNVVAALFDSSFFSGPNRVIPRVNAAAPGSVQVAFEQTGAVPVKFGSFPLFIGRRGGTSLPFNGRLYGLIVRGAQTDSLQLTNVERYLANKSGVLL